jgi:hypothetical protein
LNPAAAWDDYVGAFIQRVPRYAVKVPGWTWKTKTKPLTDRPIRAHLAGDYAVGVLGMSYPLFGIIDIDDRDPGEVERIKDALGMDSGTCMTFTSESPDSYHLIFKPEYNGRPPAIHLLGAMFREFARSNRIEIYPQWRHAVRLPFGPKQRPADEAYRGVRSWEDATFWFGKLDEYDLRNVRSAQYELDLPVIARPDVPEIGDAAALLTDGLQSPGTRHAAQFQILLSLWRQNVPIEQAERVTWNWIRRKHNGMSKDIDRHPKAVRDEITRQATTIFGRYDFSRVLPDVPHLAHDGYITRPDVLEIIDITKGNLPRCRFLHGLIKHMNPRRKRLSVGVSRDRLISWASHRTYQRYLGELENDGIVKRGRAYQVGAFSKSIRLDWPWAASSSAVLYDGRSVETFDGAVRLILKPDEFKGKLESVGRPRDGVFKAVRTVYDVSGEKDNENSKKPL